MLEASKEELAGTRPNKKDLPVKLPEGKNSDARDAAGKAAGVNHTYVDKASTGTARGWR
jgi:hypothetical protein